MNHCFRLFLIIIVILHISDASHHSYLSVIVFATTPNEIFVLFYLIFMPSKCKIINICLISDVNSVCSMHIPLYINLSYNARLEIQCNYIGLLTKVAHLDLDRLQTNINCLCVLMCIMKL